MDYLSLTRGFLVSVPKLPVSLQHVSPLSPLFFPPSQHLARLQPTIILALSRRLFLEVGTSLMCQLSYEHWFSGWSELNALYELSGALGDTGSGR
jgi:hypothetical protein